MSASIFSYKVYFIKYIHTMLKCLWHANGDFTCEPKEEEPHEDPLVNKYMVRLVDTPQGESPSSEDKEEKEKVNAKQQ
jgi:hypothetical protein